MVIQTQPLEFADFSGGITDDYIDCRLNQYLNADNFFVSNSKKLFTRFGSRLYDSASPRIPDGFTRISSLLEFSKSLFCQSRRNFYIHDSSWVAILGPSGNPALASGGDSNFVSKSEWNDHLFVTSDAFIPSIKIFYDSSWKAVQSGLPRLASDPTAAGTIGTNNYLYAFHYRYDYTANTVDYQNVGGITLIEALLLNEPSVNPITISALPALTNGATGNYDLSNIVIEVYRTINNGDTFYKVGEVNNGTPTFVDSFSDADIQLNQVIYNTGGSVEHEAPPLAKYVHIVGDVGYYANIKEGTQIISDRIRLSIPGNPSACPSSFFIDSGLEATGLSSADTIPLLFCRKAVYRIEGNFDELGRGNPTLQRISSTVGCVSNQSIIKIPGGCFFAGNDGFYFTDGYTVTKVSNEFNKRYRSLVENELQQRKIYGCYDPSESKIYFSVLSNGGLGLDNDTLYVGDLNYGITGEMCFTTYSGGDDFAPTAITFFGKNLIRGDKRGFILEHDSGEQSDLIIDAGVDPTTWNKKTIVWLYDGPATSFGTNMMRKWVTRLSLMAKNESNVSIQVTSINDDFRTTSDLSLIRFRGNLTWGDPDLTWGDDTLIWNYNGVVSEIRHFPKKSLRCSLKQIRISNGFSSIVNSDLTGEAVVSKVTAGPTTTNYVTLVNLANAWPLYAIGYQIFFEEDGYSRGFEVVVRSDTVLEILDPAAVLTNGQKKWVIKGYAKNEVLNLLSYTVHYAPLGQTQNPFKSADMGDNG